MRSISPTASASRVEDDAPVTTRDGIVATASSLLACGDTGAETDAPEAGDASDEGGAEDDAAVTD